jgi:HD-GYP domain-containing protein (c-di-GMP phosphodiesterase class II)
MAGHQTRNGTLAVDIAGDLGLPIEEIRCVPLAASIHDLGKIRIPAEVLSKLGKLNHVEFTLTKMHAPAGYEILNPRELCKVERICCAISMPLHPSWVTILILPGRGGLTGETFPYCGP